jgi:hypothetical protein
VNSDFLDSCYGNLRILSFTFARHIGPIFAEWTFFERCALTASAIAALVLEGD